MQQGGFEPPRTNAHEFTIRCNNHSATVALKFYEHFNKNVKACSLKDLNPHLWLTKPTL